LGSGADASPTACPSGWTSAGITSGGPTSIADCFQDASGIPPGSAIMYGKSGDSTNVYHCPTGTVNTAAPVAGTASFCSSIAAGYWGTQGTRGPTGAHATSLTACPINSDSVESAATTTIGACKCDAGYKATTSNTCETCPTGTDWTTAPSVGTSATFCEGVKTGFAGNAGSGADASVSGCDSGYYIATQATSAAAANNNDASGLVCTQVPANKYFTTTTSNPLQVTTPEVPTACPFAGTSAAGSSALTACTPDCVTTNSNSGAVANGGTCQCAANYYGSPYDGIATAAAASTGCDACSAGTTSTAGTTSSSGCTAASPTAASPTAASPTADSAGASTPIAVALATAAAVPLLL
jgi:hypothetical protein